MRPGGWAPIRRGDVLTEKADRDTGYARGENATRRRTQRSGRCTYDPVNVQVTSKPPEARGGARDRLPLSASDGASPGDAGTCCPQTVRKQTSAVSAAGRGALLRQPRGSEAEGLGEAGGRRWGHLGCRAGVAATGEVAPGSLTGPPWGQGERWLPATQDRGPFVQPRTPLTWVSSSVTSKFSLFRCLFTNVMRDCQRDTGGVSVGPHGADPPHRGPREALPSSVYPNKRRTFKTFSPRPVAFTE